MSSVNTIPKGTNPIKKRIIARFKKPTSAIRFAQPLCRNGEFHSLIDGKHPKILISIIKSENQTYSAKI